MSNAQGNLLSFVTQLPGVSECGHAYDLLVRQRYLYYVIGYADWSDKEYDERERETLVRYPWLLDMLKVGSDNPGDYPLYIQGGRRPNQLDRAERDRQLDQVRQAWEGRESLGPLW